MRDRHLDFVCTVRRINRVIGRKKQEDIAVSNAAIDCHTPVGTGADVFLVPPDLVVPCQELGYLSTYFLIMVGVANEQLHVLKGEDLLYAVIVAHITLYESQDC